MSRLYGSLDGDASSTEATRRAHRNIVGHVRGWNAGVEVRASVDEHDRDVFEVYRTGGSNGGLAPRMVVRIVGDGQVELLPGAWGDGESGYRAATPEEEADWLAGHASFGAIETEHGLLVRDPVS